VLPPSGAAHRGSETGSIAPSKPRLPCSDHDAAHQLNRQHQENHSAGVGVPLMAAGGGAGVVTVWDLEARRLATVLREAHDAPLTALHFFPGEPRLMSAAGDNSVKQWLFDNADGSGRLLRFRAGHAAPPACLRYYGDGTRLLSAGMSMLRAQQPSASAG